MAQSVGPSAQVARDIVADPLVEPASSGDQSGMEAFNRRDMDDVDRAVAEKRSCTNSGTQDDDEVAEIRNVKPRLNFDEADDDGAVPHFSEEPDDVSEGGGNQPAIKRHRRLGQNAPAVNTEYSKTRLVTKEESKRLKALKAEQLKKKEKEERTAKAKAAEAIRQQPEIAHGEVYELAALQ